MEISIIGAGSLGTAIAKILARAGIPASIANSRGATSLAELVAELGPSISAVSVQEAAQADMVFLAVNWSKIPRAVAGLGPWEGRIVIDTNNPIESPLFKPVDLNGRASSSVIASLLPGARLVKAFNHLQPALLASDPASEGGRRVLFVAGDEAQSKKTVLDLIARLGFASIDLGTLELGGRLSQFPGGPLPTLNLVKHG